jgi:hypothetical protein
MQLAATCQSGKRRRFPTLDLVKPVYPIVCADAPFFLLQVPYTILECESLLRATLPERKAYRSIKGMAGKNGCKSSRR